MRFLALLLMTFTVSSFAAEVATLHHLKNDKELKFYFTDESLYLNFEKSYMAHSCRPRTTTVLVNFRESFLPIVCRAEMIKFLLNNGYKAIDGRTFYK